MNEGISKFGQYLSLKIPTDGHAVVPETGVQMDGTHAFTLEAWVRLNGMGANISILKKKGVIEFGISHGKLFLCMGDDTPFYSSEDVKVVSARWNHVAMAYDGYILRFYINGEQCGKISTELYAQEVKSEYLIGSNLDGYMRLLRVYDTCLDGGMIKTCLFDVPEGVKPCADLDFTCNPPVDRSNPSRSITFEGRSRMIMLEPGLFLQSTAYAEPSQTDGINPGGRQIDPYTLQASIYVTGTQARQTIFVNGNHDMDAGIGMYLRYEPDDGGYRLCTLRGADVSAANKVVSKAIIPTDTWVNVATVYDGQSVRVYIDGKVDNTEDNVGPILMPLNKGSLLIGGMLESGRPTGTNTLQGYIRDIAVWDRALQDSEVEAYAGEIPDIDAPGLVELFDFTNEPFRGAKIGIPVALYDNACFKERITDATTAISEPPRKLRNKIKADSTQILKERQKLDIAALEKSVLSLCTAEMAGSMEELTHALGIKPGDDDMRKIAGRLKIITEEGYDMLLSVTHYMEGTDYVVVAHYRSGSEAVARYAVNEIDDCVLRIIEMLFLLIGGAITALFGLRVALSQKASDFILREIIPLAMTQALIGKGTDFKGSDVYELGHTLYNRGLLKPLVRLLVELGFWSMIRFLAKIVLTFMGIGWADTIASLIATAVSFTIKFIEYVKHCLPPPQIALHSVIFNHDLTRNDISALNLRCNANDLVQRPEWMNGGMINEPVAYAISTMNNVEIKARFLMIHILPFTVNVRAVAVLGNQLGNLGPVTVTLTPGTSGQVTFTINNAVIAGLTIGLHQCQWNWEYQVPGGAWTPMATTTHDIYLLANLPAGIWNQLPVANKYWPWTDFLRLTATWLTAVGVPQGTPLAPVFTRAIHLSGLTYSGMRYYIAIGMPNATFRLTLFITDYTAWVTPQVECSECASLLDLTTSLWEGVPLCCVYFNNPIVSTSFLRAIGGIGGWNTHDWAYHMIATNGTVPTANGDSVYDCCIQLDASDDPWRMGPAPLPPQDPIIPGEAAHPMICGALTVPMGAPYPYPANADYFNRLFDWNNANRGAMTQIHIRVNQLA